MAQACIRVAAAPARATVSNVPHVRTKAARQTRTEQGNVRVGSMTGSAWRAQVHQILSAALFPTVVANAVHPRTLATNAPTLLARV